MRRTIPLFFLLVLCIAAPALAQQKPRSLDDFYGRVAEDLRADKPLVIVAHYGMWHVRADEPERNLNWGVYYGHATMLKRARKDRHIARNFTYHDWRLVFERQQDEDPLRTLVFAQTIKPNAQWRAAGVEAPFKVYLVMVAHKNQEGAALAATRTFRQGRGELLTLDDGTQLDTGDAAAAGYFGHNFFYDYEDFRWSGLEDVSGAPAREVGIFAVGCKTARVPGFDAWMAENTTVLLFSRSLMASEGYSTLALADGILRHLDGRAFVDHADRTYQYFQKLGKPERRVGKPFVSESYRLRE